MSRGAKIFLAVFIVLFVGVLIAAAVSLFFLVKPGVPEASWLRIRLSGEVVEYDPASELSMLFGGRRDALAETVFALHMAKDDAKISGVLLEAEGASMGFGKIQELRAAIADFRSSGKPVYAWMEFAGNGTYYLASSCDRIFLLPSGEVGLTGLAAEPMFFRGSLDKLGIRPNVVKREDYKSAAESFENSQMSPFMREEIESMVDGFFGDMVKGIAASRSLSEETVRGLVDRGPFTPREALEARLVDELLYEDQLEEKVWGGEKPEMISPSRYLDGKGLERGKKKIAVVFAQGPILSGSGWGGPFGMEVRSDSMARAIRSAREKKNVAAVVFRVDSPGGSAIASDVIWREIVLTKKEKPVIISMSDVAGSGGYWIAMSGSKILAQPATITGSIGVVSMKMNMRGFYDWIGVTRDSVQRGANAAWFSDYRDYSESEKAAVERMIQFIYDEFRRKVAEGRGMPLESVQKIAQGRIWTGTQGKQNGLVDEIGGYLDAVRIAREQAGIPEGEKTGILFYPRPRTLFEEIRAMQNGEDEVRALPAGVREALGQARLLQEWSAEGPVAVSPAAFVRPR